MIRFINSVRRPVFAALIGLMPLCALKAQDTGFKRLPNGVLYKIFTQNTGARVKDQDVMTFHFIQKNDKDSVLLSSYQMGKPVMVPLQSSRHIGDLMYFFPLMAANDSALVRVPTDSIFVGHEAERPAFLPKGSYMNFTIKLEKIAGMQELMAQYQKSMDSLVHVEQGAIHKYMAGSSLRFDSTASGLRYRITQPTSGIKVLKGDSVWVNYTGRLLSGKVFDSSVESVARASGLQQPGREYKPITVAVGEGNVIPGWDEGLLLLNAGAKATLLIPSKLAYGPRGAGEDIPPYSPLLFDVEIVKVMKAAKAPAVKYTPAKTGVKASGAKKKVVAKTPVTTVRKSVKK